MSRSFVEIDVLLPVADQEDASNTCSAVYPYLEGKDCRLHVIHVIQKEPDNVDQAAIKHRSNEIFTVVRECFEASEIPVSTDIRYGRNIADVILEAADEYTAESIILTPRNRSIWRKLRSQNVLGSLITAVEQPLIIIPATD
ncbi:universal stress protein [Natronorubrum halophilum]|uniref:universal stress protein n=1 Tax=Natronorubrum halophilum TaxID=1702106 RepID=UPI000EF67D2D